MLLIAAAFSSAGGAMVAGGPGTLRPRTPTPLIDGEPPDARHLTEWPIEDVAPDSMLSGWGDPRLQGGGGDPRNYPVAHPQTGVMGLGGVVGGHGALSESAAHASAQARVDEIDL